MDNDLARIRTETISKIITRTGLPAVLDGDIGQILDGAFAAVTRLARSGVAGTFAPVNPTRRHKDCMSLADHEVVYQMLRGQRPDDPELNQRQLLALELVTAATEHAGTNIAGFLDSKDHEHELVRFRRLCLWLMVRDAAMVVKHAGRALGITQGPGSTGFHWVNQHLVDELVQADLAAILGKAMAAVAAAV